jgi:hypothetical protein
MDNKELYEILAAGSVSSQDATAPSADPVGEPPKKKKKTSAKKTVPKPSGAKRHAPGYSLLRVERDRMDRAIASLHHKAESGKSTTSVCGILTSSLIEFYDDERRRFANKFGRYLKEDGDDDNEDEENKSSDV